MGLIALGCILSLQLFACAVFLWRMEWKDFWDLLGGLAATLNFIWIGALMWKGLLA